MYIISPPSAGKNWFFDMICAFYLNVGNVANYTRAYAFPFEDCIHRGILLWNESNFMDSAVDAVKMLLGGDQCAVNIKNSTRITIFRAPVFVLSNPPKLNG